MPLAPARSSILIRRRHHGTGDRRCLRRCHFRVQPMDFTGNVGNWTNSVQITFAKLTGGGIATPGGTSAPRTSWPAPSPPRDGQGRPGRPSPFDDDAGGDHGRARPDATDLDGALAVVKWLVPALADRRVNEKRRRLHPGRRPLAAGGRVVAGGSYLGSRNSLSGRSPVAPVRSAHSVSV